jgi:ParB family transcriptional regulator, chromosome partitioning protein
MMENISSKQVMQVDLDSIQRNPFQPREEFSQDELEELAESIKTHGIIQPVILRRVNDTYQVVAGERRMRAARIAGFSDVPAIVVELDGIDVAEISLIENIQRKDLNCIEEAKAYDIFISRFGLTQEEVSQKVGKSRSHVANAVRLLTLPDAVKEALVYSRITEGHGKAMLALPKGELQEEAMRRVIEGSLSVRQTEQLIRNILMESPKKRRKRRSVTALYVDARIYFNSIKKVLKEIKESGGKADMIERETEDYLEIVIRIPKSDQVVGMEMQGEE